MASQLKVAVVHYHLKRGGVTRVIENMATAFRETHPEVALAVVTGAPATHETLNTIEVPGLGYDDGATGDPAALLKRLKHAAADCLGDPPDIWHVHNHSLGKNPAVSAAIAQLAAQGEPVFLHLHDFAEDSRPENYQLLRRVPSLPAQLYPQGPSVAYGVLNGRDHHYLAAAGMAKDRLHLLPNAITAGEEPEPTAFQDWHPDFCAFESLVLYPVRATRRKNFGELLLWATLARQGQTPGGLDKPLFLTTLGPTNPAYEKRFARWHEHARQRNLPVRLAYGESANIPYETVLGAADAFITSSVAEGFGLGFLEPWLLGKPLLGRDLPPITRDFREQGVDLDSLYAELFVPLEWIGGRATLCAAVEKAMQQSGTVYGRPATPKRVDAALEAMIDQDRVDFGRLHEGFQEQVLAKLTAPAEFERIEPTSLPSPAGPAVISGNAQKISDHYSLRAYGEKLMSIYRELIDGTGEAVPVSYLDPDAVLDQFLDPQHLNLLRCQ